MIQFVDDCDPITVESLVKAATNGLAKEVIPNVTTEAEVISAVFTLLDRTLRSLRKLQPPDVRFQNATHINKALKDMLTDHGTVPH